MTAGLDFQHPCDSDLDKHKKIDAWMDASNPLCNLYAMGNNEQYVQKESLGFQEN